jgi:hypothetical protein
VESSSAPQHGEVAGFRLVRELGAGRFSRSWLAEDAESRPFVLKLLRRYPSDPEAVQRFLEEAERLVAAPELDHPNVARLAAAGVHPVQALFVVYDSGGEATLADELRQRGRIAPARALELCAQVCEGLAAAHRAGVLHRDLKPANVGLTRLADGTEQAVVLDVATSHLLAGIGLRDEGVLPLSSAASLSPEEAAGRPPDPRSDLYAAGVLLFQLISGRLPVMGATAGELLRAHRGQRPLRLRDAGRKVADDLETLVSRLLAKDPAHRPSTGDEVALMMRVLAPVAECAPEDDAADVADDSLSIDLPEPDAPEMVAPAVAPPAEGAKRERAGRDDEPHSTRKRLAVPRWCGPAAAAAGTLIAVVLALQLLRPAASDGPAPELAVASAMAPQPASGAAPRPVAPAPPANVDSSRWAKNFERAQKALSTGHPASARAILRDLLSKRSLSRRDRARASKLMGEAEAGMGHRRRASAWRRKSLQLEEELERRAPVADVLDGRR